jgi:hypothetical protein
MFIRVSQRILLGKTACGKMLPEKFTIVKAPDFQVN